ncbi:MAG TPA: BatA domain-containing protein [Phycisphaerae bacterium]|nr:BatA domain-containing protein [Phycisphaerae bacterium]HRY67609.1 BatA domain-containing protein [Phycisphaerae bacterium]HSA24996.1 BatA domain-containing protein [Phycisphaerae bacterium]
MVLHPWAVVLGVLAVGLPVLIHWLARPRPVRLPFSGLRFIRDAMGQRRAAHRLRDGLVLGLRVMAVVLLAAAMARPLWGPRSTTLDTSDWGGHRQRVVILDVSESMSARERSLEVFERARSLAAKYLAYAEGLRVNLILAGARPEAVFERPSANVVALRDALAGTRPRPERLNIQAALVMAAQMLGQVAEGGVPRRELVVVSDFQKTSWAEADLRLLPADTLIRMESVGPARVLGNLAVLGVSSSGRVERGAEIKVDVEVGNFSPAPRQVQADITVAGVTGRASGSCPAFGRTVLSSRVVPAADGWQGGEVRLVGIDDALPADDIRPFVLAVRAPTIYALVTRQRNVVNATASYYLERALVPSRGGQSADGERVVRIDPVELEPESIARADLAVVAHPGRLAGNAVELLASHIRRGRSLVYVAAEAVDAANLKLLVEAVGEGLRMPVEFLPPTAGRPRRDLRLADVRRDSAVFSLYGDDVRVAIAPLRFSGGLDTRVIEGGLAEDVWALYDDGSAFLAVASRGDSCLAVLNVDLAATNLPVSPVFVPLLQELAAWLVGGRSEGHDLLCGEPASVVLPVELAGLRALRVVAPAGVAEPGGLVAEGDGVAYRSPAVGGPGVFRIESGDTVCLAFASVIPAAESDLRGLDVTSIKEGLATAGEIEVCSAADGDDGSDFIWVWLAAACVGCLLLELVVLKVMRT